MRAGFLAILLPACAPPAEPSSDATSVAGAPAPAATLTLTVGDLLPGHTATLVAEQAPPGAVLTLFDGPLSGRGPCLPALAGACLGISAPAVLSLGVADASGRAALDVWIPADTPPGEPHVFQVAAEATGELSPAVATEVVHPDAVCDLVGDPTWPPGDAVVECAVLAEINALRAQGQDCGAEGVFAPTHPLTMDPALRLAARNQAAYIASTGKFTHRSVGGPIGDTFAERIDTAGYRPWKIVTENIARNQNTVARVTWDWTRSDGHCADYMDPRLVDAGIALTFDRRGREVWVADHGARKRSAR